LCYTSKKLCRHILQCLGNAVCFQNTTNTPALPRKTCEISIIIIIITINIKPWADVRDGDFHRGRCPGGGANVGVRVGLHYSCEVILPLVLCPLFMCSSKYDRRLPGLRGPYSLLAAIMCKSSFKNHALSRPWHSTDFYCSTPAVK